MNHCMFMGRIASEIRVNENGKWAGFTLAVSRHNEKKETDFIPILLMGEKSVTNFVKYLKKGDPVILECRYQSYKKGEEYKHTLAAYNWQFTLERPKKSDCDDTGCPF